LPLDVNALIRRLGQPTALSGRWHAIVFREIHETRGRTKDDRECREQIAKVSQHSPKRRVNIGHRRESLLSLAPPRSSRGSGRLANREAIERSDEQVQRASSDGRPARPRFPPVGSHWTKMLPATRDSAPDRSHSSPAEAIRDNKVADLDSHSLGRTGARAPNFIGRFVQRECDRPHLHFVIFRARAREFSLAAPLARPSSLASLDTSPDIFAFPENCINNRDKRDANSTDCYYALFTSNFLNCNVPTICP